MLRKPIQLMGIAIMILILVTACSKKQPETLKQKPMDKFMKVYSEIIKDMGINDREKSYEVIQKKENQEKIKELEKILPEIKAAVPADRKILYDVFKLKYDNLVYLTEISRRKDNLSMDEDSNARIILSTIESDKKK